MAQPTQFDVHVDAPLTTLSVAYIQSTAGFVASRVFPIISSPKQSDLFFKYTKNDWFRDEAQPRADSTESAGSGYTLSTDNYMTKVWAIHKDVGSQVLKNADAPLNLLADATRFVTQRLLLRQEIQFASDFLTTSVWATDITGVSSSASVDSTHALQWSNYTSSDPIGDIKTGRATILGQTGYRPNKLVLGWQVFEQLKDHPDIIDRYKYTTANVITPQMLAPLFEVDEVIVAEGIKATNVEGETAAYSFIHGKNALLCYAPPAASLLTPSAGYQFFWNGVSDGMGKNIGIKQFPMPHLDAQRVEGQIAFVNKVIGSDLGYFFSGIVA